MSTSGAAGRRRSASRTTERLGDQARDMTGNLKDMGATVRDAAQEQIERVRDTATGYYEEGRDRVMEYEDSFEEMIREQPLKSVLIAVGVGYLIGKLF